MKRNLFVIAALFCASMSFADENDVQIAPLTVTAGDGIAEGELSYDCCTAVKFCSSQDYIALQFDINVPKGVLVDFDTDGCSRVYSTKKGARVTYCHTANMSKVKTSEIDGYDLYTVSVTDQVTPNHIFVGESGEDVLNMYYGIPSTLTSGTYPVYMTNVQFTTTDKKIVKVAKIMSYFTIGGASSSLSVDGVLPSFVTADIPAGTEVNLNDASAIYGSCTNTISAKYSRTVSTQYSTLCVPFDAEIPAGCKAYQYDSKDDANVYFKSVTSLEKNKAYLLETSGEFAVEGTSISTGTPAASGFVGTCEPIAISTETGYGLKSDQFQAIGSKTTVPAFHAFLKEESSGAKGALNIVIDEQTTGINTAALFSDDAPMYNINGVTVNAKNAKTGIYVKNGKKVAVK